MTSPSTPSPSAPAATLNQDCECITLDDALLDHALMRESESFGLAQLNHSHPHLFSRSALFVDAATLRQMRDVVAAVERVAALPGYLAQVLQGAHPHARVEPHTRGAFLGYDFHLSERGPQLIEINTNAGGGLLNALLRSAQRACCEAVAEAFNVGKAELHDFFSMFEQEWSLARADRPLRRVAVVDDHPDQQYLYPEFVLFARMCSARGIPCVICDPSELSVAAGELMAHGQPVDLVYNRLTDFTLSEPGHATLAEAYVRDLAVVTPHPRAHMLYADKRRLALLSDERALLALGATAADAELLERHVPKTVIVRPEERERLWSERKRLFFKPQSGYGSKAAYRGDKVTKTVFEQLLQEPYVAQLLVPPSGRTLRVGGELLELKVDVRNFAYAGAVQLVCARLYQGQTTNFRTVGGGFAPVYETKS